jgi:hypothetical protein
MEDSVIDDCRRETGTVSVALPDTLKVRATVCDPSNTQGPQLPDPGLAIAWVVTTGGGHGER